MKTIPDWHFAAETLPEQWPKTRRLMQICLFLAIVNLLAIVAAPLARLYLSLPAMQAFQIFFYAVLAGIALALAGVMLAVIASFKNINQIRNIGLIIFLLGGLPAAGILLLLGPDKLANPIIHDITTDTVDPPAFVEARRLRSDSENSLNYVGTEIAAKQLAAYPDIQPLVSSMNLNDAMDEAIQVVKDLRWEFINIDFEQGIIEAYDTSRIFGFVDDIVIRVRREGSGSRIDIRSVSRVGKGDMGKNADRIRLFKRIFRNP